MTESMLRQTMSDSADGITRDKRLPFAKMFKVSLLACAGLWACTLGIFRESYSKAVMAQPNVCQLSDGTELIISAYIAPGRQIGRGVPYGYYQSTDVGPRPLVVIIRRKGVTTFETTFQVTRLRMRMQQGLDEIDLLADEERLWQSEPVMDSDGRCVFSLRVDNGVPEAKAVDITIAGKVNRKDGGHIPFETTVDVPFEMERYTYIGWMKLLYLNQM